MERKIYTKDQSPWRTIIIRKYKVNYISRNFGAMKIDNKVWNFGTVIKAKIFKITKKME